MVSTYKKKKPPLLYTQEQLVEAVTKIKNGEISIYKASKIYKIPRTTLRDHISGRRGVKSQTHGRNTDIPKEYEQRLSASLATMEKWGFGVTKEELIAIVANFVKDNELKTQFTDGIPGDVWFRKFTKRNNLSLKKPQSVEYARKQGVDPFHVYPYFQFLKETMEKGDLMSKPWRIYNVDETSFCSDPSKLKIVGRKGAVATRTTSGPGKTNISVCFAASASGAKIPPLIIFKGKNIYDEWLADDSFPNTTYGATENGWMETQLFSNWFKNTFLPNIGTERPVILIFDGHTSHVSLEVVELALKENISILKLPPHTSHCLQPLDLSVFKSLKSRWEKKLVSWQKKNIGTIMPKKKFASFIGELWTELPEEIIINGFRAAGIIPFNSDIVNDKFEPLKLQRWLEENPDTNLSKPTHETEPIIISVADLPVYIAEDPDVTFNVTLPIISSESITSTKIPERHSLELNPTTSVTPLPTGSPPLQAPLSLQLATGSQSSPIESQPSRMETIRTSFEELLLKHVKRPPLQQKNRKTRVACGAEVISSEDVANRLREKKREQEKAAAEKITRRQQIKDKKTSERKGSKHQNKTNGENRKRRYTKTVRINYNESSDEGSSIPAPTKKCRKQNQSGAKIVNSSMEVVNSGVEFLESSSSTISDFEQISENELMGVLKSAGFHIAD